MFFSLRLAALTVLFISHIFGRAIPLVRRAQLCNGYAELCDRSYGNVTFFGAHDSFAASSNPMALARTQEVGVNPQLSMGVRMLQLQAHMHGGHLHFCHTTCALFDGGTAELYFQKVRQFLDRHPNEVLTIIIANPENISAVVWQPIFESTGLADIAYVPPQIPMSRAQWPTLKQMLDSTKRVVVFMDKGAEGGPVSYLLQQFTMMWEDEYDPTDSNFPCKIDRTTPPLSPPHQLNLINHNLNFDLLPIGRGIRIPHRLNSPRTNSVYSIEAHANHCASFAGDLLPNFILLDFIDVNTEQVTMATAHMNGLKY